MGAAVRNRGGDGRFRQVNGAVRREAERWLREAGDGFIFRPTKRQRLIWEAIARAKAYDRVLIGYGGAVGGGKTRALAECAIDGALEFPGNSVLVGRRDLVDLRDTTMRELKAHIPRDVVVRENKRLDTMDVRKREWPAGVESRIYFRGLKEIGSLASTAFGFVVIDEAYEVPGDVALYLFGRLRHRLPPEVQELGYRQKFVFLAASNPFPSWFKRWFVDRDLPEALRSLPGVHVEYIPARISDNPHLDPGYEASLRAMYPESWVRRLVEGEWDVMEGAVYPEFSPSVHRWRAEVPKFVGLYGGLDFGGTGDTAHATAGLIAGLTENNVLIRLDEFIQRGGDRPIERLVRWMGDAEDRWMRQLLPRYAGERPTWTADGSQQSFIQLLQRAFRIRPSDRSRGAVRYGIALVSQRLSSKPPGSFYLPHLTTFEDQILRYHWPHRDSSDTSPLPNSPVEVDDDILDCDRYIHMTLESRRPDLRSVSLPSLSPSPTPHSSPIASLLIPSLSSNSISYQPDF